MSTDNDSRDRHGAHEVAAWLRRHPRFLQQFPDLALSLVVPREEGSASSLASYQLEVLRDKNRELNRRLNELYTNALENERLTVRTHQLALALMRAVTPADTVRTMAASLAEDFQGESVRMVLFTAVEDLSRQAGCLRLGRREGTISQVWRDVDRSEHHPTFARPTASTAGR